jgi:hypothetical protein
MTLKIIKAQANRLILTLNELSDPLIESNWLFRFNKDQGGEEYLVFLTDLSPYPETYNEFEIIEGTQLTFLTDGDYKYEVYQMPDTDDTDYTRGISVEIGKARVVPAEIVRVAYTPNKNKNVYIRS